MKPTNNAIVRAGKAVTAFLRGCVDLVFLISEYLQELAFMPLLLLYPRARRADPAKLITLWLIVGALAAAGWVLSHGTSNATIRALALLFVTALMIAVGAFTWVWDAVQHSILRVEVDGNSVQIVADRIYTGANARAVASRLTGSSPGHRPDRDFQFFVDGVRQPAHVPVTLNASEISTVTFVSPWQSRITHGEQAAAGAFEFQTSNTQRAGTMPDHVVPERDSDSVSDFLRETAAVIGYSLPILISQATLMIALVYAEQGRAFLLFDLSAALPYLFALGAISTVVFSRVLARRVDPDPNPAWDRSDRMRWLALQCGSGIAGLVSGFMPAAFIEDFASGTNRGTPLPMLDAYRDAATTVTILVAVVLGAYLIWRIRSRPAERTYVRDGLLLPAILLAAWASELLSSKFQLIWFGILLIAIFVALTMAVLRGPAPAKSRGGILEWRARLFATIFLGTGIFIAVQPEIPPSGVALWIALQFWMTIAVLLVVLLRFLWRDHLGWCFIALSLLVLSVTAFSGRTFNGRDFRTMPVPAATKPSLHEFTRNWLERRLLVPDPSTPYPVILVASAGGGIRAAFWTANLLSAFQDQQPAFADHVLAISAVSGGSVGAAVFDALIKEGCSPCRPRAHEILNHDFLAPALTTLLTRDVFSATLHIDLPDRGVALEKAFERAWAQTMHTPTLERSLDGLWNSDPARIPGLFLNATEAGSAQRAVFSNVSLSDISSFDRSIQAVADNARVRLSTAMILSARFPYISPEALSQSDARTLRFVDGGYFDNSGAATLLDIVKTVREVLTESNADQRFNVVVLYIRNEPLGDAGRFVETGASGFQAPLTILDKLRGQRADAYVSQLQMLVAQRNGDTFLSHFEPEPGDAEFPLGWTLPETTVQAMDAQITKRIRDLNDPMAKLLRSIAPSETSRPGR